MYDIKNDEFVV